MNSRAPGGSVRLAYFKTTEAYPRRFAGKEKDQESGFDYFGARYYAQRSGRFTTSDPDHVGGDIFDPQSWNAYAYAGNNPLRSLTQTGRGGLPRTPRRCGSIRIRMARTPLPARDGLPLDPADYNYGVNVAFVNGTLSFIGEDASGRKMLAPWSSPGRDFRTRPSLY